MTAASEDAKTPVILLCAPDHYEVAYAINPWMEPAKWAADDALLRMAAKTEWQRLHDTIARTGARIEYLAPAPGVPDMVFTANAGCVWQGRAVVARFACAERQGEEAHIAECFEGLRARGLLSEVTTLPEGMYQEGHGDFIRDAGRDLFWCGWGQRSKRESIDWLGAHYGVRTEALELVDPRFYHLDTCFQVFAHGDILVYPGALAPADMAKIREIAGADKVIEGTLEEASTLALNAINIDNHIICGAMSERLTAILTERGYEVHICPLPAFNRSGGSAYCLSLRLDNGLPGNAAQAKVA